MLRARLAVALLVSIAVLCTGAQSRAQSLVDAAKRAEEQRKAAGAGTVTVTNGNLPGGSGMAAALNEFVLTEEGLSQYFSIYERLMRLRIKQSATDAYLMRWEHLAKSPFEMETPYGADQDVISLFSSTGLTPDSYFMTELAFRQAVDDDKGSAFDKKALSPSRRANIRQILNQNNAMNFFSRKDRLEKELDDERHRRPRK